MSNEEKHKMDVYTLIVYKDLISTFRQLHEIADESFKLLKKRENFQKTLFRRMTVT